MAVCWGCHIMLLNWREDKGHYKKTIPVTASSGLVRVLAGESGKCWGYFMFILHSSLPYNSSTNIDYLQNDCKPAIQSQPC